MELPNHIIDRVEKNVSSSKGLELFEGTKEDIDLKSDVLIGELIAINNFMAIDNFLKSKGINSPYNSYIQEHLRLKVSKERLSRGEFTTVNTPTLAFDKQLQNTSNLKNILESKT